MSAFVLTLALALDAAIGEPDRIWRRVPHPAVLMGRAVDWCDRMMNHGRGKVGAGAMALFGLVLLGWWCGKVLGLLGWPMEILVAAILIAQRSLVQHVAAVGTVLNRSLEDGRAAVGKIVGRDTAEMTEAEVARAAIESAAENISDGVVAPAFWFLLLGLPGLIAYKMVNTADSMIGYRNEKYEAFGKAAAKLDDLLNWIPARLTALLIFITAPSRAGWQIIRRDAPLHRSPNAGWPESAMAVALNVALAGPRNYHGKREELAWAHPEGTRDIGAPEIFAATRTLWLVWAQLIALTLLIAIV
ncbi:MAG: adenosylcobinamide-phosphate synthase [Rhodobacterales bacterium]|nr:MAG: adenosylcobinamide-phosphate synthase [Rhodobacterales bacterium]